MLFTSGEAWFSLRPQANGRPSGGYLSRYCILIPCRTPGTCPHPPQQPGGEKQVNRRWNGLIRPEAESLGFSPGCQETESNEIQRTYSVDHFGYASAVSLLFVSSPFLDLSHEMSQWWLTQNPCCYFYGQKCMWIILPSTHKYCTLRVEIYAFSINFKRVFEVNCSSLIKGSFTGFLLL